MAESYDDLGQALARGDAEMAWVPAAVLAKLESTHPGAARMAYTALRNGSASYRSAIVTHSHARYERLEDLAGVNPAWADPLSLGGCVLATDHLRRHHVELGEPTYLGSHPAALEAVLHRTAEFGAVSVTSMQRQHVQSALTRNVGEAGAHRLKVLAFTDPAPNDAFVLTRALTPSRTEELRPHLFETGPAHRALCLAMETDGFTRADLDAYRRLAGLLPDDPGDRSTLRPTG